MFRTIALLASLLPLSSAARNGSQAASQFSPLTRVNNLTFSQAAALPGVTLTPGTYMFEAGPANSNPNVVRVSRNRQTLFMGMTIPTTRAKDAEASSWRSARPCAARRPRSSRGTRPVRARVTSFSTGSLSTGAMAMCVAPVASFLVRIFIEQTPPCSSLPSAHGDERSPIERIRVLCLCPSVLQHGDTGSMHCIRSGKPFLKAPLIERPHPYSRRLVIDRPEAHDHRACAGHLKRTSQPENTLSCLDLPDARVAGGQYSPLHSSEVQRCNLFRRENAVAPPQWLTDDGLPRQAQGRTATVGFQQASQRTGGSIRS